MQPWIVTNTVISIAAAFILWYSIVTFRLASASYKKAIEARTEAVKAREAALVAREEAVVMLKQALEHNAATLRHHAAIRASFDVSTPSPRFLKDGI